MTTSFLFTSFYTLKSWTEFVDSYWYCSWESILIKWLRDVVMLFPDVFIGSITMIHIIFRLYIHW